MDQKNTEQPSARNPTLCSRMGCVERSPPRLSGIPGISLPVAAPNHKGIAPAPLLCPIPSCLWHVHLDPSTAWGWGALPGASWGRGVSVWLKLCQGLCTQKCRLLPASGNMGGEDSSSDCMPGEMAAASSAALEHTSLWKPIP